MNNSLTHEQAIRLLHEAAQHLTADQRSDLTTHLAECDQCRAYADQLYPLQPLLARALRLRR